MPAAERSESERKEQEDAAAALAALRGTVAGLEAEQEALQAHAKALTQQVRECGCASLGCEVCMSRVAMYADLKGFEQLDDLRAQQREAEERAADATRAVAEAQAAVSAQGELQARIGTFAAALKALVISHASTGSPNAYPTHRCPRARHGGGGRKAQGGVAAGGGPGQQRAQGAGVEAAARGAGGRGAEGGGGGAEVRACMVWLLLTALAVDESPLLEPTCLLYFFPTYDRKELGTAAAETDYLSSALAAARAEAQRLIEEGTQRAKDWEEERGRLLDRIGELEGQSVMVEVNADVIGGRVVELEGEVSSLREQLQGMEVAREEERERERAVVEVLRGQVAAGEERVKGLEAAVGALRGEKQALAVDKKVSCWGEGWLSVLCVSSVFALL